VRPATIARNYAEALFDLGEKSGQTELYADLLDAVAAAIEVEPTVQAVLMSPRVTKPAKSRLLAAALPDAPREFVLFLQAVVKRGRQALFRHIATEFMTLLDVRMNRVRAGVTLLDVMTAAGQQVVSIGKVRDLFAGRGITRAQPTASDTDGFAALKAALGDVPDGLIFVNLVDSDMQYGHRNDVAGYAANLERIDAALADTVKGLRVDDLLVVTGDHGNDPTTPSTDHSREYVPLLVTGARVAAGRDLGTRTTFADLGQTIADNFGVGPLAHGTSFMRDLVSSTSGGA
jgi:F0F1-type ATP synthase delta subunit